MFAPRYFAPTFYAPRYWAPGIEGAVEAPSIPGGSGVPFVRRKLKKPKSFRQLLDLQSDTGSFDVEIPPIPVEETAASIGREVQRFQQAIEIVQAQEQQVETEIDLLAAQATLELLIRREILIGELLAAREFILDLQEQAEILRLIRRRRQEEEAILMALMLDDDNMNITVH
jgi:hypothetical protein